MTQYQYLIHILTMCLLCHQTSAVVPNQQGSGGSVPARGRSRGVVTSRVEDLVARRDGIDAEVAERRLRENDALERWVSLAVEREQITTSRDDELARLEAERSRVQDEAAQRVALVDTRQAAVLLGLSRDSRTAHQLSALFELPLKQVRDMVRAAKTAEARDKTSKDPAESTPQPARGTLQDSSTERRPGPVPEDIAHTPQGDHRPGVDTSDSDRRETRPATREPDGRDETQAAVRPVSSEDGTG